MTYDEIGDEIEDLMDDDDTDMRTIINKIINETYFELLYPENETNPPWWLEVFDTVTLADGTQTYDDSAGGAGNIATDIRRILSMSVNGEPIEMFTDVKEIERASGKGFHDTSTKGTPYAIYHSKAYNTDGTQLNKVYFYLTPDSAYTVSYWYEKRVSALSATTDVPMMPEFAHSGIVHGSLVKLALFDLPIKAGPWAEFYKNVVGKLNNFRMNKHFQG